MSTEGDKNNKISVLGTYVRKQWVSHDTLRDCKMLITEHVCLVDISLLQT